MKKLGFILTLAQACFMASAQRPDCVLRPPQVYINFGSGNIPDPNMASLASYRRVRHFCPSDGYYSFASHTERCFDDDWHTLTADHSGGDVDGNMLLVNAAPEGGVFLRLPVEGLKSSTTYEVALWVMNLCRPTEKCPTLLLPSLSIRLQTPGGQVIANLVSMDLPRVAQPTWMPQRAFFTTPASPTPLILVMADNAPGGCGNDFALDDITFRECVKQEKKPVPAPRTRPASKPVVSRKEDPRRVSGTPPKKLVTEETKKETPSPVPDVKKMEEKFPAPPLVLKTRENALLRRIEATEGDLDISIYDNGEIDGDTVSVYHNNELIASKLRLSGKPISIRIRISPDEPHHELIMVAENLGSIPPNTSVMMIKTPENRYRVFISSNEQKNAKIVFDLKSK